MLGPVRAFAENQPVASIVDAIPNRAAGLSVMTFGLRWHGAWAFLWSRTYLLPVYKRKAAY